MNILVTGQIGLDKAQYLQAVKQNANSQGRDLVFVSIGQRMIQNHPQRIGDSTILNLPRTELDILRRMTWKQVVAESRGPQRKGDDIFVISTHSVFRWHHGLFPALDLELVTEFSPDMVVVLVDDILEVKRGLRERDTDIFEFWELFAWREEEIWFSKFVAESVSKLRSNNVQFFIVPKSQGPGLLTDLIFKRGNRKIYTSFPITGVPQADMDKIEEFKAKIREEFVVFDPYSVKDRKLVFAYYTAMDEITEEFSGVLDSVKKCVTAPQTIWSPHVDSKSPLALTEWDFDGSKILGRELLSVLEAIDSQIISRDYMLIDQSDFLIMYIRRDETGEPRISAGCQAEMVYAYSSGKDRYVVFPGEERALSPWITQYSKAFKDLNGAFDFIAQKHAK